MDDPGDILSTDEVAMIAMAAIQGSGRPLSTAEIAQAVEEVRQMKISGGLAELVLRGDLVIEVPEDGSELYYRAERNRLTREE